MHTNDYMIRQETPGDYRIVEHLTREAFWNVYVPGWNVYVPGCNEHYLVHVMRKHADFIPELDLVLEHDGQIIGNVMYTESRLVDENANEKQILTFGPLSILPAYQRTGYGKALLEHSFQKALALGYDTIVIFGDPGNYVARGFKSCKKYNVCLEGNCFPMAMLVKELKEGSLDGRKWYFHESPVGELCSNEEVVEAFDAAFPPKEKKWQPSQEVFYIHCHSTIG